MADVKINMHLFMHTELGKRQGDRKVRLIVLDTSNLVPFFTVSQQLSKPSHLYGNIKSHVSSRNRASKLSGAGFSDSPLECFG